MENKSHIVVVLRDPVCFVSFRVGGLLLSWTGPLTIVSLFPESCSPILTHRIYICVTKKSSLLRCLLARVLACVMELLFLHIFTIAFGLSNVIIRGQKFLKVNKRCAHFFFKLRKNGAGPINLKLSHVLKILKNKKYAGSRAD